VPAEAFQDRPLIGLSAWLERVRWDIFEEMVAFVEASFVEKLAQVGADTVILPAQPHVPADLVRNLDGLILTGGPDVQAPRYIPAGSAEPRSGPEAGRRDANELALAGIALEEEIPVLGVCRGCQLLNVYAGGTLVPEVTDRYTDVVHTNYKLASESDGAMPFDFARHEVEADPESPIGAALGLRFEVLSSHHQAIDRVAPDFRIAGRSDDGLIEAIYRPEHPFAVGVQWHPEAGSDPRIFAALVAAARARRRSRPEGSL